MKAKRARTANKPRAATSDVVGSQRGRNSDRVPAKWREHHRRLLQLREELSSSQSRLAREAAEEAPAFSSHMADAGTDTYDRDLALSMLSSEHNALYEIDQALHRIRNGTYGICELTGKPINAERLTAVPWARFNLAAEKKLEQQGARDRTRLGRREAVPKPTAEEEEEETE